MSEDDKSKYVRPFPPQTELKYYRDWKNTLNTASKEGKIEGKIEVAEKMVKKGYSPEEISEITELSREESEKL